MCFTLKVPLSLNNELKQADLTCSLHDASAVLIVTVWRILSLHFLYLKLKKEDNIFTLLYISIPDLFGSL